MQQEKERFEQEAAPSLEENFTEIEEIIKCMEGEDVSLDDSFALYQRGISRLRECYRLLDEVEKKMQVLGAEDGMEE